MKRDLEISKAVQQFGLLAAFLCLLLFSSDIDLTYKGL